MPLAAFRVVILESARPRSVVRFCHSHLVIVHIHGFPFHHSSSSAQESDPSPNLPQTLSPES